jgi:hypothetical protein
MRIIAWFINAETDVEWQLAAKIKQLSEWVEQNKPFGEYDVLIIPARENKFCIIDSEEEILSGMSKEDVNKWVHSAKTKIEECITVELELRQ